MQFETDVTIAASAISRLTEGTMEFLGQAGVDARAAHHVALVLEEMLSNLAIHGGAAGRSAAVRIVVEPDCVRGEIIDDGPPFDPRHTADPDMTSDIDERPVGGLGLFLVRRLTSTLDYVRTGGRNCTQFSVPRAAAHPGGSA